MEESVGQEPIRLQKLLAQAGVGSRRYCEILIERGRVRVNGLVVTELGTRAQWSDEIEVDGVTILSRPERLVYAFNKPVGVVSSMKDEHGRRCISDFLSPESPRLFHVGRLDEQTSGLLILTNDGELAQELAHPRFEVSKTYMATVRGQVSRSTIKLLLNGIVLEDGPIACDAVVMKQQSSDASILELVLHSGRNRIVRRMLSEVGHPVTDLARTHIGNLGLDGLRPGGMRLLNNRDLKSLTQPSNRF